MQQFCLWVMASPVPGERGAVRIKAAKKRSLPTEQDKPVIYAGFNSDKLYQWYRIKLMDLATLDFDFTSGELLQEAALRDRPDILVILRQGGNGGLPDAGRLAIWGLAHNFAVILIAGSLDEDWAPLADQVRRAGGYVLGCLPGETINSFELLHLTYSKVKELTEKVKFDGAGGLDGYPAHSESPAATGVALDRSPATVKPENPVRHVVETPARPLRETAPEGATVKAPEAKWAQTAVPREHAQAQRGGILANLKKHFIPKMLSPTASKLTPLEPTGETQPGRSSVPPEPTREAQPGRSKTPPATLDLDDGSVISSGAIAIVSPWQPSLPGRLTAAAARLFAAEGHNTAVIGISKYSTAAGRLGVEEDELIMSDWRVPGSQAPVVREKIKIWAVDPTKALEIANEVELGLLIAQTQLEFQRVIIDCADDHNLAQKLLYQDVAIIYIVPGKDPVEQSTARFWLNRFYETGRKIFCGIDLRETANPVPEGLKPHLVIRDSPEAAVYELLQKYVS